MHRSRAFSAVNLLDTEREARVISRLFLNTVEQVEGKGKGQGESPSEGERKRERRERER